MDIGKIADGTFFPAGTITLTGKKSGSKYVFPKCVIGLEPDGFLHVYALDISRTEPIACFRASEFKLEYLWERD